VLRNRGLLFFSDKTSDEGKRCPEVCPNENEKAMSELPFDPPKRNIQPGKVYTGEEPYVPKPAKPIQGKGHRGHAYCGRLCLPAFLYDEFQTMLGPKASEFDLLTWVIAQDKHFAEEYGVIDEPLTVWRGAFRAELAAKGWTTPRQRPVTAGNGSSGFQPIAPACPHNPRCDSPRLCLQNRVQAFHRKHAERRNA